MHPECLPETPKPPVNPFMGEINLIATAGERIYSAIGGDEINRTESFTEMENGYPVRIPISAFCVRLAYFVWNRIRDDARLDAGLPVESENGEIFHPISKVPPIKVDPQNPISCAEITHTDKDGKVHTWKGDPKTMPEDHPLRGLMTQMGLLPPLVESPPQTAEEALDSILGDTLKTFGPAKFTEALNRLAGIDKKSKPSKKTKPTPGKEK